MANGTSLKQIIAPVEDDLRQVELHLQKLIRDAERDHTRRNRYSEFTDEATAHVFRSRGKRLRPTLLLLSARCTGAPDIAVKGSTIELAAATEIVHNASLVHDDVIDESAFRRMRRSVNARYGNKTAVLVGNVLYAEFFAILENLDGVEAARKLELLRLFTDVTKKMCFGEMYEARMKEDTQHPSFEEYLDMLNNKTATLVAASCESGAIAAAASSEWVATLRDYGHALGMAYQLLDDIADGDSPYPDEGKCLDAAAQYLDGARSCLERLPESEARQSLAGMIEYIRTRSHLSRAAEHHA